MSNYTNVIIVIITNYTITIIYEWSRKILNIVGDSGDVGRTFYTLYAYIALAASGTCLLRTRARSRFGRVSDKQILDF